MISIIIPYRDREEHLEILLPVLHDHFAGQDYEIIVSEQNDQDNFRISCVQNIAARYARGDVLIFHQVDYVPSEDVSYQLRDNPLLPAKRGIFLDKDHRSLRPLNDIPAGYRSWTQEIDPNFYGGVIVMSKDHFYTINGFNPLYRGWGNEDEDLRERFKWAGIKVDRAEEGTFYCLYHEDNGDMSRKDGGGKKDFLEGRRYLIEKAYNDRYIGATNLEADVELFETDDLHVRWIKSTNYRVIA